MNYSFFRYKINRLFFLGKIKLFFRISFLMISLMFSVTQLSAQEKLSSDELFAKARKLAFDDKNYSAAIALTKQALAISPDYADIKIFLGRLYTYTDKTDSARMVLSEVFSKNPSYEDAALAYGNLEYWNDHPAKALEIVNQGLSYHQKSEDLLLLKAKILKDLHQYQEANVCVDELLKINPKLSTARALSERLKDETSKNNISFGYDFSYFDKQFSDPWHLANLSYGRLTKLGSITARLNYGNRFKTDGLQAELDAYPKISKVFYAYLNVGYGGNNSVFPKYRYGFSLYANLPAAFEGELGFRTLQFGIATWIYTASVGKYYKNYWFNLRTYLTPSNSSVSQSVSFTTRYYFGSANDYLSMSLGTGISPDNDRNVGLYNNGNAYKLKSNNVSLGFNKAIKTRTIISLKAALERQEYLPHIKGNQLSIGLALSQRF